MANRFFNPDQQFSDATGLPYAGGSLTFYASGTTTPLNTYSDSALTIANTNPVVLDSAGRSGSVFLQNLAYKVVLADVNNNVIWTFDPVYSSDFSTVAQFQSGSGSPNGVVAGTAGSSTIPASSYWDATNNILYICTQTGTVSTAVWTAINAATAAAVVPTPQGYLTLTSGTPVIPGDVTGATTVFYTPYTGNIIPVYNGSSFTPTVFAEISCTLVSAHAAATIYDMFVFNNSGVLTLVTGPAWNASTAGSSSRGTGAGTTQLSRVNGLWVNTVSMTGRNGSTTYTIPASQATYVGSMLIDDGAAGQVSCHRSFGQSRKWGIWNAYNRVPAILLAGDSTATWTMTATTASRAINGNPNNSLVTLFGLPEEETNVELGINVNITSGSGGVFYDSQIGLNSTSANVGRISNFGSGTSITIAGTAFANFILTPTIGRNNIFALESVTAAGAVTVVGNGGQGQMGLTASFRA